MEKYLLIVDDNQEIVDVIESLLCERFDKVMSANTVEEALEHLEQRHFSFIVLDINLEGRNGAEIIKYLMEHPENANHNCPFVIVSGFVTPQFIERYSQRFAGILVKPFAHDELERIVDKVLPVEKRPEREIVLDDIPYLKCDLPFPIAQLEQKVEKIMSQVKKNAKLKQVFSQLVIDRSVDNFMLAHIGMLINISTGISIQMEWNTEKTLEKFVYAAYLHDMAIYKRPDLARIKDLEELNGLKDQLSAVDFKMVFEHPNIAARTIEEMTEIPSDVAIIVRQHHELPKENGFPSAISHAKIVPLSVIFIIAHDLTHYIIDKPEWNMTDYLAKAKVKFKGAHFQKVLSSLSEIK